MRLAILCPFILLLFSLKICAIGISSPYLENNTIKLIRGESVIYSINLQNPEDVDIDVKIDYNSEITKIIDYKEAYTLPAKTRNTKIAFNITAPEKAETGKVYTVSYSMKPLSIGGEGTLPMTTTISKKFNVEITKDPNSADVRVLLYYAAFIIVFAILFILIWKKRKDKF